MSYGYLYGQERELRCVDGNPYFRPIRRKGFPSPCNPRETMPKGVTVSRLIGKREALDMVKPQNRPLLERGHKLSVSNGVYLQKVKSGAVQRYRLMWVG